MTQWCHVKPVPATAWCLAHPDCLVTGCLEIVTLTHSATQVTSNSYIHELWSIRGYVGKYLSEEYYEMSVMKSEDNLTGEGGLLIHGKAILKNLDRSDLFSQELDRKLASVVCNVCLAPSSDLASWRHHCVTEHASLPGYGPQTLGTGLGRCPELFSAASGQFPCPRCRRRFATGEDMEDHRHSQMRCVRLVCGQCSGLWSDLESHMITEHGDEDVCRECGLSGVTDLIDHYHESHEGFASVIAETELKCAGDGVSVECFETVLGTTARFLASEVKPERETKEEAGDILDTSLLYSNASHDIAVPKITQVMGSSDYDVEYRINVEHKRHKTSKPRPQKVARRSNDNLGISTVEERNAYNIQCYQKLQQTHMSRFDLSKTNNCDICGFEPYTKNKYREKQDHLTKHHFKEKIERLLPLTGPYNCPDGECQYVGKDKQVKKLSTYLGIMYQ